MKPRVLYLDVDDTILRWDNLAPGLPANKAKEFIEWAKKHFEIRWLTAWCPSGKMGDIGKDRLAKSFKVRPEFFNDMDNPNSWGMTSYKTDGIDYADPRPWVWVEDEILEREAMFLTSISKLVNFLKTDSSSDPDALVKTWAKLRKRFNIED